MDGIFYLMGCLAEKGRSLAIYEAVRVDADPQEARQCIADALPPMVASVLGPAELEAVHQRLRQLPEPPARARLGREDWLGGVSVSLLVFASTFPVVIPFMVMDGAQPALRVSNAIAIVMRFGAGFEYGRRVGRRSWTLGLAMVVLGTLLAGLTVVLGG